MSSTARLYARRLVPILFCLAIAASLAPPVHAALIVDFDASTLFLTNGANVPVWNGQPSSGTPTYLVGQTPSGKPAVQFNGTDHFGTAILPSNASTDFIIAAVVAPTATGAYHNLIDDDDSTRPMLWIDNGNTYEFNFGNGAAGSATRPGPVTGAFDIIILDSRLGTIRFNSPAITHSAPAIAWNPGTEAFDFFNRDGGSTFQGLVADFRVYNNAADFGANFAGLYQELYDQWFVPPVPEPSTLSLVGLGACGLAWRRRRARLAK